MGVGCVARYDKSTRERLQKSDDGKIKLEDYFTVYPRLPNGFFGAISGFLVTMQLPEVCKDGNTILSIQSLPSFKIAEDKGRFAMDWHVSSTQKTHDINSAQVWLSSAHKNLKSVFEGAFSKQGLNLFEPERV